MEQLSEWDMEAFEVRRKYDALMIMAAEMAITSPKLYKKYSEQLNWVLNQITNWHEDEIFHALNVDRKHKEKYGIALLDESGFSNLTNR